MTSEGNVLYYLELKMKELHIEIQNLHRGIEVRNRQNDDDLKKIAVLKVHYTSLLNTALAYEDFDEEDFKSRL